MARLINDKTGQVFNELKVIAQGGYKYYGKHKEKTVTWDLACIKCGNITNKTMQAIKSSLNKCNTGECVRVKKTGSTKLNERILKNLPTGSEIISTELGKKLKVVYKLNGYVMFTYLNILRL